MRILIDMYMAEKLDLETSLAVYLGTSARARRFRKHQHHLGAVISGAWSYLFLRGAATVAPNVCPLDIFVDHRLVPDLAKVLRPMSFQYCSVQWELLLDHRQRFEETFHLNNSWAHGSSEGAIVYCFTNGEVLVCIFGTTHGILNAIFEQRSSE